MWGMCVMVVVVIEWVKKGNAYSNWLNWVRNTLVPGFPKKNKISKTIILFK